MRNIGRARVFSSMVLVTILSATTVSASTDGFRQFRTFNWNYGYYGRACVDGISVGHYYFVPASEAGGKFREEDIDVQWQLNMGDGIDSSTQVVTQTIRWQDNGEWSPFCKRIADRRAPGDDFMCEGLVIIPASQNRFPVGEQFEIVVSGSALNPRLLISKSTEDVVEECRIDEIYVSSEGNLVSPGQALTTTVDFELVTYDPNLPDMTNGAGITSVNFKLLGPFGNIVHEADDTTPPYCLFGESEEGTCHGWDFNSHNFEWPSGEPIGPGAHHLTTVVQKYGGRTQRSEWTFDIERTYWQQAVYLPYVEADSPLPPFSSHSAMR